MVQWLASETKDQQVAVRVSWGLFAFFLEDQLRLATKNNTPCVRAHTYDPGEAGRRVPDSDQRE